MTDRFEEMLNDVTIDRDKYIGGSDMPAVMGISPYKTRFELLQEKAGLRRQEFTGNAYTEYGHTMESVIRDYINETWRFNFKVDMCIQDRLRYHADGVDLGQNSVLEVKTTSEIFPNVSDYKQYLVQLLLGMKMFECEFGVLAVYHRPEDMSTTFDSDRLHTYSIKLSDFPDLLSEMDDSIAMFLNDWDMMLANPFMDEEDFVPVAIVEAAHQVISLENALAEYKEIEKQAKALKEQIKELMEKHNLKTWETPNGTKITLVADGDDKVTKVVDEGKLAIEYPEVYEACQVEKTVKGKKGFVKITLPKVK